MGLLDQVLGQVIGGMAGQGGGRGQAQNQGGLGGGPLGDLLGQVLSGGRGGAGSGAAPQGGGLPGGLGDLLGSVLGGGGQGGQAPGGQPPAQQAGGPLGGALGNILAGAGGKYSPLVLALLAMLANKHLSSGSGGLGTILHDMFSGGRGSQAGNEQEPEGYEGDEGEGEPPPGMEAPPFDDGQGGRSAGRGSYADRGGSGGRGGGGGFLDEVGSMLDGPGGARPRAQQAGGSQSGLDDLIGGGIDGLNRRFDQNGQGDLMGSWVGGGQNRQPSPQDLDQAFGPGTIDQLARQTGLSRDELLQQLSHALPQVIDGLTPKGRLPQPDEQRNWI